MTSSNDSSHRKVPNPQSMRMKQTTNWRVPQSAQRVADFQMSQSRNDNAGTSKTVTAGAPKKRCYDDDTFAEILMEIFASREKTFSTTTNPVVDEPVITIEESQNEPEDAVEKSRKTTNWATNTTPAKKRRRDSKQQPQEAKPVESPLEKRKLDVKNDEPALEKRQPPQSTREVPSTSLSREKQQQSFTEKELAKRRFYEETWRSGYDSLNYKMLLKNSKFTDEQVELLQQSFHLLYRHQLMSSKLTDRSMKTHQCVDCEFSISHQCVSPHLMQYVRSNGNLIGITFITPESSNICMCGFGIKHSHKKRPRNKLADNLRSNKLADNLRSGTISRLTEHHRSIDVSCPHCNISIVMRNRNQRVCSNFVNLANFIQPTREFREFINQHPVTSGMSDPIKQEFYTCATRCCVIFHRCPDKTVCVDPNVSPLLPMTTYTHARVSSSNAGEF